MKRVLAILLICSILLQCTAQFAVIALFHLRKEYIAKNLCENRTRPQAKCNGKCYLKKQLKKVNATNEADSETSVKMEKEMLVYIVPYLPSHLPRPPLHNTIKHAARLQAILAHVFVDDIFHPPSINC